MFRFSLQEVMDFRMESLLNAEQEYLEANRELNDALSRLDQVKHERESTVRSLQKKQDDGISPGESWIYQNYLVELDTKAFDMGAEAQMLRDQVNEKREVYQTAHKDVDVMEKLRDKELKEFQYNELKNEEKMLNDLAIFKFRDQAKA